MLCSMEYCNTYWTNFREPTMPLQDIKRCEIRSKLLPFSIQSTDCQWLLEYDTKHPLSVTIACQILVVNTCPKSCKFMHHLDNSIRPVTTAFFVYRLSKQKHTVKDPFHMQVLCSRTNFRMTSEIHTQKPPSKKAFKTHLFAVHC